MTQDPGKLVRDLSQGRGPSILLLFGDDFRVREASRAILDIVAPDAEKTLNADRYDGRSHGWDEIEAALMTPSLFAAKHAVVVDDAPYFAPAQRKGGALEKALALWTAGQKDAGARAFMGFLSAEGWTRVRWLEAQAPGLSRKLAQDHGVGAGDIEAICRYCREEELELVNTGSGDQHRIEALVDRGLPAGAFLLMLAAQVDRRTRLFKKMSQAGCVLDLSLERDRSGRIRRESLAAFLDQRLGKSNKRIEPRAREMVLGRCGEELWAFHQEIEKLLLYAGDAASIRTSDVEEVFTDRAEGWVFDLTDCLGRRDVLGALRHLRRLLDHGEVPLRLLGAIASEMRRLLQSRELLDKELAGVWRRGMTFNEFQRVIAPEAERLPSASPYASWLALERAERFSLNELNAYRRLIEETDARLKSSGQVPQMAMERLLIEMTTGTEAFKRTTRP